MCQWNISGKEEHEVYRLDKALIKLRFEGRRYRMYFRTTFINLLYTEVVIITLNISIIFFSN